MLRRQHHRDCFACSSPEFRLEFDLMPDGRIVTGRAFGRHSCSYAGHVHGGLLSLCIDEAMTCALMAYGVVAVTGRMSLRYLHPVLPDVPVTLSASLVSANPPLFEMQASIIQGSTLMVKASAKFMSRFAAGSTAPDATNNLTESMLHGEVIAEPASIVP